MLEPISKSEIFRSGEARAFRKAEFTRSLPLRGPAFEKGDDCKDAGGKAMQDANAAIEY